MSTLMLDLGLIAEVYTKAIAGIGGIDAVTNLLTLVFLAVCVALALRGPASAFSAAMLISAVMVRLPVFTCLLRNPDEAHMLAGARRLYYDPVFWRSVDGVTSGPLNYYALASLRLFGLPLNFATARFANVLCLWGALVLLWLTAREFMPEWAARLSVLPWLAAAAGFRFVEFLQYSSECVPLLLGSLALWLLVRERWFALGVVLASLPLAKLQALPMAAAFGVAAACKIWRGDRRDGVRLAGGLAAVLLALSAFLTIFGLWHDFDQSFLRSNLSYIDQAEVEWTAGRYFAFIAKSEIAGFLAWMALWIVPVMVWRRRVSLAGLMAGGLFVATLYAIYQPGREFPHYLLLLMLPAALGGMIALAALINNSRRPKLAGAAFVAVTVVAPTIHAIFLAPPAVLTTTLNAFSPAVTQIAPRLKAWVNPGDLMAVWGWAPELNVLTGTVPATRDAQSQRQIEDGPHRDYYLQRYLKDLRANPPRVFADAVAPFRPPFENRATQGYESVPALREFVNSNYELQDDVQGIRVFARKAAHRLETEIPAPVPLTIVAGSDGDRFHYGGGRFEFREETAPEGYRSARFCRSTCEYSIPMENGCYRVRLHFIELIVAGPGQRVFDVTVNRVAALRSFDIFREASRAKAPIVREFTADIRDGRLTIGLVPIVREADISRIEVVKNTPDAPN